MILRAALNGVDLSSLVLMQDARIRKDSTDAVSVFEATLAATPDGIQSRYDECNYDEAYYTFEPIEWDQITVTDTVSGTVQFAGYITAIQRIAPPGQQVTFKITCADYGILLDTTICTQSWSNESDHNIILAACAGVPGITVAGGNIATIVASLPAFEAKDITLRALLESLCNLTGGEWRVDYSGNLKYYASGTTAAPWGISDTPDNATTFDARMDSLNRDFTSPANYITVLGDLSGASEIRAVAQDAVSQGKYGIRSATVVDRSIADVPTAQLRANAEIAQRAWPIISGTFTCWKDGLDVGQTIPIASVQYALSTSYLIRTIELRQLRDDQTEYKITFGQRLPDLVTQLRRVIKAAKQPTYIPTAKTGEITISNFASTIEPVAIVTATPDGNGYLAIARVTTYVLNTTDRLQYWWDDALGKYRHKIGAGALEADSVTAGCIAVGAIRASDAAFDNGAIQSADIGDAQITNAKINRLGATKLVVTNADIQDAAITNAKIDRATANKLVITNADIQDATIASAKIASLNADKINAGTISVGSGRSVSLMSGYLSVTNNTDSQSSYLADGTLYLYNSLNQATVVLDATTGEVVAVTNFRLGSRTGSTGSFTYAKVGGGSGTIRVDGGIITNIT